MTTMQTDAMPDPRAESRKDWRCIIFILLAVLPLRGWLLYNTEVAARDSVGFIRYALEFEKKPWNDVLKEQFQHPGYPFCVWLASIPVRAVAGLDPDTMRLSAQLVSALASLLLCIPLFFLGKELFDRRIGFWGALLFQFLPVSGQTLSDGVSESLYLLLLTAALWQGVIGMRSLAWPRFAACGALGGMAYLVRPEGLLLVASVGLALVLAQLFHERPATWWRGLHCGAALGIAAAAAGAIYFMSIGQLTNKPAGQRVIQALPVKAIVQAGSRPCFASVVGVFIEPSEERMVRLLRGLHALGAELLQGLHYLGAVPAVLGFAWSFGRMRRDPGFWAIFCYALVHAFILVSLAMVEFYVSERHVLPLTMFCCFWSVAGAAELTRRVLAWRGPGEAASGWRTASVWSVVLILGLIAFGLPKTTARLHHNRVGNRAAGVWLTQHLAEGDMVLDDHAWSHYYSGQVFEEGKDPELPEDYTPTCYVVVTRSRDAKVAAERDAKERELLAKGHVVYFWPEHRGLEQARVVVYSTPRDAEKHRWKKKRTGA